MRDDPIAIKIGGADDALARRDIGQTLDMLIAMRWYLDQALEDGEEIPDVVKTHMKWADSELDLSIAGLRTFLGVPGLST